LKIPNIMNARFVRDEASQVLALSDALASENGAAISAAFLDIARSRGIAQISCDAGLSEDVIYEALADSANPDAGVLRQVVSSMLRLLPGNDHSEAE
jgi:probable addiction module antidote protein